MVQGQGQAASFRARIPCILSPYGKLLIALPSIPSSVDMTRATGNIRYFFADVSALLPIFHSFDDLIYPLGYEMFEEFL